VSERQDQAFEARTIKQLADDYAKRCFEQQTPPRVSELAAQIGLEAHQLNRLFHRVLHMSPSSYLKECQVAYARRLLRSTKMSTTEIAYATGFGTRVTFFRAFGSRTGMTPAEYRARHATK
jgi:transcriptional regulator GlxA family with amidase domain